VSIDEVEKRRRLISSSTNSWPGRRPGLTLGEIRDALAEREAVS